MASRKPVLFLEVRALPNNPLFIIHECITVTAGNMDRASHDGGSLSTKNTGSFKATFRQNKWILALCILTGLWLVATIIFATAVATSGTLSLWLIPTNTAYSVLILRALSEGASLSLTALLAWTLGILLWTHVSRPEGVPVPTILAMSPTTRLLGLLELLRWKNGIGSRGLVNYHTLWVVIRFNSWFELADLGWRWCWWSLSLEWLF